MSKFIEFRNAVYAQIEKMKKHQMYLMDVSKDKMTTKYLDSFPEGTNPIYLENTQHDCRCCKNFIRDVGHAVAIINGKMESIWSIQVDSFYQEVADAMHDLITNNTEIREVFHVSENDIGVRDNFSMEKNTSFSHFCAKFQESKYHMTTDQVHSITQKKASLKMAFEEFSFETVETTVDLMDEVYKGEEFKLIVEIFFDCYKEYHSMENDRDLDIYCWGLVTGRKEVNFGIRNSSIGQLMKNIEEGMGVALAVKKYEEMVAPSNYQRNSAVITKRQAEQFRKEITEKGLYDSLIRRHAKETDLSVADLLYVDRDVKTKEGDLLDNFLFSNIPENPINKKSIKEIGIEKFLENVLPKSIKIEAMMERKHVSNLVSLIASEHEESPSLFKWGNRFSWGYKGDVTDSIKERVKKAGGNVGGVLRCSLSWFNYDDLDIHVQEPCGNYIRYDNKNNYRTTGSLDVDMNATAGESRESVENISWTNPRRMGKGKYKVIVHNFSMREYIDYGFEIEIECNGEVYNFTYNKKLRNEESVVVAEFNFDGSSITNITSKFGNEKRSQDFWGIGTEKFHKVKMIMTSPNYWESGNQAGNRHWFFILDGCVNDEESRGFYNEYLRDDLRTHRKALEALGNKMKISPSDEQLSGLGFSSTIKNSVVLQVTTKKSKRKYLVKFK